MSDRKLSTVFQVVEALEYFKSGYGFHQDKKYKEAIESFQKCSSVNPYEEAHLKELIKKLKAGGFKLIQESIAHMGCAAEHLKSLLDELDESDRQKIEMDKSLKEAFEAWG